MKKLKFTKAALSVLVALGLGIGVAWAAGYYPGFPNASAPLPGSLSNVYDTNYASGRQPQTETVTLSQVRAYIFGDTGAGAVTLSSNIGTTYGLYSDITTEALSTANGSNQPLTITNSLVTASSRVDCSLARGTSTVLGALILDVTPTSNAFTIELGNRSGSAAINGTYKIRCIQTN